MSSRYYTKRQSKKRPKKGVPAPAKPKAFKSTENAKSWADSHGMKGYNVVEISKGKFKIRKRT